MMEFRWLYDPFSALERFSHTTPPLPSFSSTRKRPLPPDAASQPPPPRRAATSLSSQAPPTTSNPIAATTGIPSIPSTSAPPTTITSIQQDLNLPWEIEEDKFVPITVHPFIPPSTFRQTVAVPDSPLEVVRLFFDPPLIDMITQQSN